MWTSWCGCVFSRLSCEDLGLGLLSPMGSARLRAGAARLGLVPLPAAPAAPPPATLVLEYPPSCGLHRAFHAVKYVSQVPGDVGPPSVVLMCHLGLVL